MLISPDHIIQWRCNADSVCRFISESLGLRRSKQRPAQPGRWEIGIATGDKNSQMLCLEADGVLSLVAGDHAIPLVEFIGYQEGAYSLDTTMIRHLVDDAATTADNRYTPTTARREARKLATQAMYRSWQKAYRQQKKKNPNKSDVWYSRQIAKMDIAKSRSPDTIKKHMKL